MSKIYQCSLLIISFVFSNAFAVEFSLLNASVISETTPEPQLLTINVKDGVIDSVSSAEVPPKYNDVRDIKGQLLLPGLIDMHSHGWGNSSLRNSSDYQYIGFRGTASAMIYAGIHGWLDLFSDEQKIFAYRDEKHYTLRNEAQIFAAGPCFTATGGHCSQSGTRTIDSPEDVQRELKELLPSKPNVLKVVYHNSPNALPTIDKPTLKAFLQQAREAGIPTVVHVGSWEDLRTSAQLGASAVTHLPWSAMPDDIPQLLSDSNTAVIPTVGLIAELLYLNEIPHEQDPRPLKKLNDTLTDKALLEQFPIEESNVPYQTWLGKPRQQDALMHLQGSIARLLAHNITILPGSDAANEAMYQGTGMHVELFHLQSLGIPARDLLISATSKSYAFLEIDWGIVPGAPANFLVADIDTLNDIAKLSEFSEIYVRGRKVERNGLLKYATPDFFQYAKLFLGFED